MRAVGRPSTRVEVTEAAATQGAAVMASALLAGWRGWPRGWRQLGIVLAAAQQPGAQFYANFDPANLILCMHCPAIMLCEASASPWPCVLRQTAWRSR